MRALWLIILLLNVHCVSIAQPYLDGIANKTVSDLFFLDGFLYASTIDSGVYYRTLEDSQWTNLGLSGKRITSISSHYATPSSYAHTVGVWPNLGSGDSTVVYDFIVDSWITADEGIKQDLTRINAMHSIRSTAGESITIAIGEWSPILKRSGNNWEAVTPYELNGFEMASSPSGKIICSGESGFGSSLLLLSTDEGNTWNNLLDTNALSFGFIHSLAINPTIDNIIITGTQGTIRGTPDAGSSWNILLTADCTFDAMVIDPFNPNLIFSGGASGDSARLFRSSDGGLNWDEILLPDGLTGITDLELVYSDSLRLFIATSGQGVYTMTRPTSISVQYARYGWNLLSVPRTINDYSYPAVYPSAVSSAYNYLGSYIIEDTLSNGVGYWIKFDAPQQIVIEGSERQIDSIEVHRGWNIIGSISEIIDVNTIESTPGGIINSQFFGYNGKYNISSTIRPGMAYWVKVTQDGVLILNRSENILGQNR